MRDALPVKLPPEVVWVPLIDALSWIRYQHSVDLEELLRGALDCVGLSYSAVKGELEHIWHELADRGTIGEVRIRGKRDGEATEISLGLDDLRNCRFLAWTSLGDNNRREWMSTFRSSPKMVARVERHPDTLDGAWDRLGDAPGHDYYDLVVLRSDLLRLWPPVRSSVRKLRNSGAAQDSANKWLAQLLDQVEVKSVTKAEVLPQIQDRFKLSKTRALQVWAHATRDRPEWKVAGRPPKSIRAKSNRVEIAATITGSASA